MLPGRDFRHTRHTVALIFKLILCDFAVLKLRLNSNCVKSTCHCCIFYHIRKPSVSYSAVSLSLSCLFSLGLTAVKKNVVKCRHICRGKYIYRLPNAESTMRVCARVFYVCVWPTKMTEATKNFYKN